MNTFGHFLSSFLGVIAEYSSNHAQKWRKKCPKVFNASEFHFSEVTFFQNWYFSYCVNLCPTVAGAIFWALLKHQHPEIRILKILNPTELSSLEENWPEYWSKTAGNMTKSWQVTLYMFLDYISLSLILMKLLTKCWYEKVTKRCNNIAYSSLHLDWMKLKLIPNSYVISMFPPCI